jgi:hypothetical protein
MGRRQLQQLFLVERLIWNTVGDRPTKVIPEYLTGQAKFNPYKPGAMVLTVFRASEARVPIKAYIDRTKSEEACRALDDEHFAKVNPFDHGSRVKDWSSFDEGRLRDFLLDHGLEPPEVKKFNANTWRRWYDSIQGSLDAVQRRAIREAMDRVIFYQVSELTA